MTSKTKETRIVDQKNSVDRNAWIAINARDSWELPFAGYTLLLKGQPHLYQTIAEGDWTLIVDAQGNLIRVGRVLRPRCASASL
jgi:hypothetical protein